MTVESRDPGQTDRRMALAREWDELVEKVRELDGFEDFLKPPRLQDLLPAAVGGPVVVINVSQWRCDALIVKTDGVRTVPLPELGMEDAADRANRYLEALRAVEAADAELASAQSVQDDQRQRASIRRVHNASRALVETQDVADALLVELQAWMWDAIASPILDELGLVDTPTGESATWPRLWWCPTGPLTVLPIHAAGYHLDEPSKRRTVIDRVVSSYTPTLRALLDARSSARRDVGEEPRLDRMMVVSVGNVDGQSPLETEPERTLLKELFPGESCLDLAEDDAVRDRVRTELARHRWAHFSCHGDQDLHDPSQGGVWLHDGMLTVADLVAEQFDGDFIGLSACKTATGGIELLDEAITLAAALHYLGYRHVVATLWSVTDKQASEVFEHLYRRIAGDGRLQPDLAPSALHDAVKSLRDRNPEWPHRWTPFTHTGP